MAQQRLDRRSNLDMARLYYASCTYFR